MNLNLEANWMLGAMLEALTRTIIQEGGTRSGKTISIAQWVMLYCLENTGKTISVVRKTFPALRISAMRDFLDVLTRAGLYDEAAHSKGNNTYTLNGNLVEFMSVDDPQKKRGSARDVLWGNEVNELEYDDYLQLVMRTRERIILDYNPSEPPEHWINTHVLTLPPEKLTVIHSTYVDNAFLPDEQREEIERLRELDPALWSVFGLGKWAQLRGRIYTNREPVTVIPMGGVYGIDFGHTAPTAVVRCLLEGGTLYWEEVVYETHMTNSDLIERLKAEGLPRGAVLYCDAAEPDRIEELKRAGFSARPAKKDVKTGVDFCRRWPIRYVGANIGKEIASYKWAENRQGDVLDEPIKYNDHAMDAARYGTFTHYFTPAAKTEYKSVVKREAKFKEGAW